MRILYNIGFLIFGVVYLPYFIVTKRYKYGMGNRCGMFSNRLKSIASKNKVIWVHAVSVGEMKAASILAPLLRNAFPLHRLLFSTVTHTGNKVARVIATGEEEVFYLPFDLSFIVARAVKTLKPEIFISLETELWPNLIIALHRFGTKIILINGRISEASFFGYRKVKWIISGLLEKFALLLMQSEEDRVRILTLGAPKEKVFVTGNLKFDLALIDYTSKRSQIRERLRLKEEDILLVGGSTHRGEEERLLDSFSRLKKEHNNLRLLIAPRHVERTSEIERLLAKNKFASIKVSSLNNPSLQSSTSSLQPIFILDTIGDLRSMYSASDIVFVGGSLVKRGGQNPIEPASLARPIIFGKYTFNFQDVVKAFLDNQAAIRVDTREELCYAIKLLIDKPKERKRLGMNAKDTVNRNSGSSQRTIERISRLFVEAL